MRQFASDCEQASGAILPYVGTVDVARDLDRLRQALGDSGLTYMGQSYGTLLGATYAQLFPTHIRAMVLDSAIDPALSFDQMTLGQAEGFEGVLNSFFAWCAATPSCQWRPAGDPTTAVLALIARSYTSPAPAGDGRTAGTGELYDALLDGLYSQSDWPSLGAALAADESGEGSALVAMSNHYSTDGSTNGADAGRGHRLSRPSGVQGPRLLRRAGGLVRHVGPGVRTVAGLGGGGMCGLARRTHPHAVAGHRAGLAPNFG